MFKEREELAGYRLLEFPNESDQSWPVARRERDELLVRFALRHRPRRTDDTKKKVAA